MFVFESRRITTFTSRLIPKEKVWTSNTPSYGINITVTVLLQLIPFESWNAFKRRNETTHTHTHTHIYIYICMYIYICGNGQIIIYTVLNSYTNVISVVWTMINLPLHVYIFERERERGGEREKERKRERGRERTGKNWKKNIQT